jgi:hypothetical protein
VNRWLKVGAPFGIALWTIATFGNTSDGSGQAGGPISVAVESAEVVDGLLSAEVTVASTDTVRHEIEVWTTLGIYGASDAWQRRVSETTVQTEALRTNESKKVQIHRPAAVPAGSYELTVWVRLDDARQQVVQFTHDTSVEVEDSAPLSRIAADMTGQAMIDVAESDSTTDEFVRADVAVGTVAAEPGSTVQLDLIGNDPRTTWWERPAITSAVAVETVDAVARIEETLLAPPGTYHLRLQLIDGDGLQQDQVLLAGDLTVNEPDPSIRRTDTPVGPLVITRVAYPTTWGSVDDAVAVVEVENLSSEPLIGELWWHLAAAGHPEPWVDPEASSVPLRRLFEPGERRSVRLSLDGELKAGSPFELSVWVHADADAGGPVHSDGVLGSEPVALEPEATAP